VQKTLGGGSKSNWWKRGQHRTRQRKKRAKLGGDGCLSQFLHGVGKSLHLSSTRKGGGNEMGGRV